MTAFTGGIMGGGISEAIRAMQARSPIFQLQTQLQKRAAGQGPSAAEELGQALLAQQQRGLLGAAASATGQGVSPGLALREGMQAAQQAGLEANAQFSAMRAEEQQAYLQQLQDLLLGRRQLQLQKQAQDAQTGFGSIMRSALGGGISGLATGVGMGLMK